MSHTVVTGQGSVLRDVLRRKTLVKLKRVENSLDHSPAPGFI